MLKGINFEEVMNLEVGQVATISATKGLVTVHRISSEQVMSSLTANGNLVAVVVFNLAFMKFLETTPENKEEEQYWVNKVLYNNVHFEESGIVMRSFVNDHGNKSVVVKTTTDIQDGNLYLKKDTAIMMAEFNMQYLETIKETFKK